MNSLSDQHERFDSESVNPQIFWDEFQKISSILESEMDEIINHLKNNDSQVWRRVFCRTFFAYLEGEVYSLKQLFLFYDWWVVEEEAELKIRNQKLIKNQDGTTKVIDAYLPLIQNVKLIFDAFAAAAEIKPLISENDECWNLLSRAVKIRNRIVHPKRSEDLTISDEEIELIREIGRWYLSNSALLLEKRAEALFRLIQIMEKAAMEQFGPRNNVEEEPNNKIY